MLDADPFIQQCLDAGFALAGVCEAQPIDAQREFTDWLAQGKQGSMAWLADDLDTRLDPSKLIPGARSVIVVADQYAERGAASAGEPPHDPTNPTAKVARYAQGPDYHVRMKKRLYALCDQWREQHPGHTFRGFVDILPVMERVHASRASLGWIGKHTLLIHPILGSYFSLGGILTTLPIAPPPDQQPEPDHCGTCTRCIDACPTQAITPYSVDASRCISYLTVEHRGEVDPRFFAPMGDWLFGCDICQDVCPHNSARGEAPRSREGLITNLPLLNVLAWTAADRARVLSGTAIKRATLAMLKRNAIIAAVVRLAEYPNAALRAAIERLAIDPQEDAIVREAAQLAQRRLDEQRAG